VVASSEEAESVNKALDNLTAARRLSQYLGDGVIRTLSNLCAVYEEASEDNWDGQGARPADQSAYFFTRRFIASLRNSDLPTDITVDPDGEFSINWDYAADRVFSVSVGANGRLAYAGRFGPNRVRGVEYFTHDVPEQILRSIRRVQPEPQVS